MAVSWTSVKDDLPPDDTPVLCWDGFHMVVGECHQYPKEKIESHRVEWYWRGEGPDDYWRGPTHWQLLPPAPDEIPAYRGLTYSEPTRIEGNKRIIAAACLKDGKLYTGKRHGTLLQQMSEDGVIAVGDPLKQHHQGFVDGDMYFLSRKQAAKVAYDAGQILDGKEHPHGIFSEDLW